MKQLFNYLIFIVFIIVLAGFIYKNNTAPKVFTADANSTAIAKDMDANNDNQIDRSDIEQIIKEYIISHPEILLKAGEELQKKQIAQSQLAASEFIKTNIESLRNEGNPPYLGNKDAETKIVLFYDYNCSYCKEANNQINKLIESDGNVKIILRPLPILGASSENISKFALAVYRVYPDKFTEFHNSVIAGKKIDETFIQKTMQDLEIDSSKIENELTSISVQDSIKTNFEYAKKLGINGAPSQVVGEEFVAGMLKFEQYVQAIEKMRSAKIAPANTAETNK